MSESSLLFFSMAAVVFFIQGQKKWFFHLENIEPNLTRSVIVPFILAGGSIGLAAASKIHAFLMLPSMGLLLIYVCFRLPGMQTKQMRLRSLVRIGFVVVVSALLVFIILNPFLYSNPFGGLGLMFKYRLLEMTGQALNHTELSALPYVRRLGTIFLKLMGDYASIHGTTGLIVNMTLLAGGMFVLLRNVKQTVRTRQLLPFLETTVLLLSPLVLAALMSPLDWERYFLYPVFVLTLINAYGLAGGVQRVLKWFQKRHLKKIQMRYDHR